MSEYLDRITQAIDYLSSKGQIHKQLDIVAKMGKSQVNVSRALNGNPRYLTAGFLKSFAKAYGDYINLDWLLTGEGEMAKPEKRMHPFLEAKAAAGSLGGDGIPEDGHNLRDLDSFFPGYQYLIRASGKSMEPVIFDEDILVCRRHTDSLNPPIGRICVIDTKDSAVVKEVTDIRDGILFAHSLNPDYPDLEIEAADINGVAVVVGSLRPNL